MLVWSFGSSLYFSFVGMQLEKTHVCFSTSVFSLCPLCVWLSTLQSFVYLWSLKHREWSSPISLPLWAFFFFLPLSLIFFFCSFPELLAHMTQYTKFKCENTEQNFLRQSLLHWSIKLLWSYSCWYWICNMWLLFVQWVNQQSRSMVEVLNNSRKTGICGRTVLWKLWKMS